MTGNPQVFRLPNLPRFGGLLDPFTGFSPHISWTSLRTLARYGLCLCSHGGSHEVEITENTEAKVPWTVGFGWAFERRRGWFGGDWFGGFDPTGATPRTTPATITIVSGLEFRTDLAGHVYEFPATRYSHPLGNALHCNWGGFHHSVIDDG